MTLKNELGLFRVIIYVPLKGEKLILLPFFFQIRIFLQETPNQSTQNVFNRDDGWPLIEEPKVLPLSLKILIRNSARG
jgi:hypothetical protein